ncbi:MAG: hypothetical protein ACLU30_03645 [Odoribacter splanchnicus]
MIVQRTCVSAFCESLKSSKENLDSGNGVAEAIVQSCFETVYANWQLQLGRYVKRAGRKHLPAFYHWQALIQKMSLDSSILE